jgi:hypothetical protein
MFRIEGCHAASLLCGELRHSCYFLALQLPILSVDWRFHIQLFIQVLYRDTFDSGLDPQQFAAATVTPRQLAPSC